MKDSYTHVKTSDYNYYSDDRCGMYRKEQKATKLYDDRCEQCCYGKNDMN